MHGISHILLGLTAMERWGATRRIIPHSAPQEWSVLIGVAVMVLLLVLLLAVSYRRRPSKGQPVETFAGNAQRRGHSERERQILLAVALRSGLPNTDEVFHEIKAFHRGAAQLLAECGQTRTPPELDALRAEILRLRLKLGFQKAPGGGGAMAQAHPGSRAIPVGATLELTGRGEHAAVTIQAEVLRNDEAEFAVALPTPLESKAGEAWLAYYSVGLSLGEFHTSTVSCHGQRLVLTHGEEIRFTNRRRFPRMVVRAPALLAHLPFVCRGVEAGAAHHGPQHDPSGLGSPLQGVDISGSAEASLLVHAPTFVESTVTEWAGPELRLETPLQVLVGDRVLVVFRVAEGSDGAQAGGPHTVAAVGRVKHGRDLEHGVQISDAIDRVWDGSPERDSRALATQPLSVAVTLTGLTEEESEELASVTNELFSRTQGRQDGGATRQEETAARVRAAT